MNISPFPPGSAVLNYLSQRNKTPLIFILFVYFDEFRYKNIEFPLYFCDIYHYNDTNKWGRRFFAWVN